MAAASLKAPSSPWKATRKLLRFDGLIDRRYLAISGVKQKAEIRRPARKNSASHVEHNCSAFPSGAFPNRVRIVSERSEVFSRGEDRLIFAVRTNFRSHEHFKISE